MGMAATLTTSTLHGGCQRGDLDPAPHARAHATTASVALCASV
jgi:hypothetical protein